MSISVAIMAHPARAIQATALEWVLTKLPFSDVAIIYNEDKEGLDPHQQEWDTGERCLRWGIGKADWHLVIQDDAILTPSFYQNLVSAIQGIPTKTLISLYTGQTRPWPTRITHAVEKADDGDFLSYWMLLWGVGIAIPSDHIEPMLEFVLDGEELAYDSRIGMFYNRNMLPIYYTIPSLVDHGDNGKSLLEGHGILPGARIAHRPATGKVAFRGKIVEI